MPSESFFSHSTAALLHQIPVPARLEFSSVVHIAAPSPSRAPHATGILGHRLTVHPDDVEIVAGVRSTTAARTWCDLASQISLLDLIAAGDFLIHWRDPVVTATQLRAAVLRQKSRRGLRDLHAALALLNDRSESPPESVLRALLALAGFPEPRVNHVITDHFGEFVARTDLIIDEYRLVLEYQGDYHRTTKGQWRSDMTRRSKLESTEGLRVMELNADDLKDPGELMYRIRLRIRRPD